ncbi:MAG: 3-phosphoshikimate 1-carboxyvinyltransferase [Dehalococcoidales bacterium]
MKVSLGKSKIEGQIEVPPSKSYTIRALFCAALANGESEIINPLVCDDTEAAQEVLRGIGAEINTEQNVWRVRGGNLRCPDGALFCGDSAATLRFMTAVCALLPGECRLVTGPSLSRRPVVTLIDAVKQLGVECFCDGEVAPVVVRGGGMKGGLAELPGNISSQYISALLIAAPLAGGKVRIRLTSPPESKSYIWMTMQCMRRFGITVESSPELMEFTIEPQKYQPARYRVEGDWSSASYFLAMGSLFGNTVLRNLDPESIQGDRVILDFLKNMGASVERSGDKIKLNRSKLKAIQADLSDAIDLLPTMAVLAALAEGESNLEGIARARLKESNRVTAVKAGLEEMGVAVCEEEDGLTITGTNPKGAIIDSSNDHRIAMAFCIAGLVAGNTVIKGAECVSKTYPEFWETVKSIGGRVKLVNEQ